MNSRKFQDTSTPKRRRLGRILLSSRVPQNCSPISSEHINIEKNEPDRCESPVLPCNQVEYRSLCDSVNNSPTCDIPCSPDVLQSSIQAEWETLDVCTSKINEIYEKSSETTQNRVKTELMEDISDDMFHSKLEQSAYNHKDKSFKENIEESFDIINQSISNLDDVMKNKSCLFETRDSFLLDIKEEIDKNIHKHETNNRIKMKIDPNSFYGLPIITKGLFKTYRNIEKFYGEYIL